MGPVHRRAGLTAATDHADLLISIHADGAAAAGRGFHVIHPTSTAGFTAATAAASTRLATLVRDRLVAAGRRPSTYVAGGLIERSDLGTLNRAGVPAALVECGNMRNTEDLRDLEDPAWRARTALAIGDAIGRFLS